MNGMCGWFGGELVQDAPQALARMSDSLSAADAGGVSHTALHRALYQQTAATPQPVLEQRGISAAICGHVRWKDTELDALSKSHGHHAALIEAYRRHGEFLLHHINGHFALAVLDPERQRALLAVDHIGAHPMCYAHTKDGALVFGSTTDAVRAHPDVASKLSMQALYDYVYFHMIPSPDTVYAGINKLEPAQCLWLENGKLRLRFYWQPAFVESDDKQFPDLQDEFLKAMRGAVTRCDPDQHTGAFLSGGTDSSTVSGMLAGIQPNAARTYSIGFAAEGYDEISYARLASNHFHTQQHEYYVTPQDVADSIPHIARAYDEPFGNSSAIPTYYCARMAKQDGMRVLLAGDGGDELFGGNARYAKQKVFDWYQRIPSALRRNVVEPLFVELPFSQWLSPTRKIRSYIEQARVPMPERMESYNFLSRTDPRTIFQGDFLDAVNPGHPLALLQAVYQRAPTSSLLNRMLYMDWKITLADNDLRKVNRMCALAGIEVRYPMLDDELVEFSARVAPELKLKGLKLRYFFKKSLENFLPHEIINKSKHGFGLPFGEWLKTSPQLQDIVYTSLQAFKARGMVRPEFIDELITTHRSGHASYYGTMLWVFAFLEQWFQQHKVAP